MNSYLSLFKTFLKNFRLVSRLMPHGIKLFSVGFVLMSFINFIAAKETSIIFKGKSVLFKKIDNETLEAQWDNKPIIASTKLNLPKTNKLYLGTFRKLKRKNIKNQGKKLVTYHVYEK